MKTYKYPLAKSVVVSGDIHGDFNRLVFKMCVQYEMRDTLLIVAGDCGFGFESRNSYEEMAKRNSKRLSETNNWIVLYVVTMTIPLISMVTRSVIVA